jgi:hypothetical protein
MPKVSSDDGAHSDNVATSAPGRPATRQPISVAISMFGPGAACARANKDANSPAVIHGCTCTT